MTIENLNPEKQVNKNHTLDAAKLYVDFELAKSEHETLNATREFVWKDVGESRISFENFYNWLKTHRQSVFAPRTGHIGGSWEAIMQGGGAGVAFNRGVIELGIGYPLVFDTNMTPAESGGDKLYYPGSILNSQNKIIDLQKYSLQNGKFQKAPNIPLYSPFVATLLDNDFVAINNIHRSRMQNLPNVAYSSLVMYQNFDKIENYINAVIQRALLDPNPFERKKIISKVLDRWVSSEGFVSKANYTVTDTGLTENDRFYSWDNFINLFKTNLYISAHPEKLAEIAKSIPPKMPLMSKEFLMITFALLDTDFTYGTKATGKINPHFHWGGLQMAGVGRDRGYFQSAVSDLKLLMSLITKGSSEPVMPIGFTLMPAGIFQLLPHKANASEVSAINILLRDVSKEPEGKISKSKTLEYVEKVVDEFIAQGNHKNLSDEFLSRFTNGVHPMTIIPKNSDLVMPETFFNLSLSQLSITAGVLKTKLSQI